MNTKCLKLFFLCLATTLLGAPNTGFNMELFPMNFLGGKAYTVAENMPAVVKVRYWALSQPDKTYALKQSPVLTLQLPDFLVLEAACLQAESFQTWKRLPAKRLSSAQPNLVRWEIPFFISTRWNNILGVGSYHAANKFYLYLRAAQGSSGRQATIRARIRFGTLQTPEVSYPVSIRPPVQPIHSPAQRFELSFSGIPGQEGKLPSVVKPFTDFITMLTTQGIDMGGRNWKNHYTSTRLITDSLIGCAKQFPYLMSPESFKPVIRMWQNLVYLGKVPPLIGPNGKQNSDPRATPAWYLVDDPLNQYDNYLRKGCRMFKKYYPQIRRFYWDYEPGVDGFDYAGRLRFAWKMNLKDVPTRQECTTGKFRKQWFDYMVQIHREHLEKVRRVFKEELPNTEFWICTDNLKASTGKNAIAYWCAVDNLHADKVVNGHQPMIYYAGKSFFDDLQFNLRHLTKPIQPICDPCDDGRRFFLNYTPPKIKQNMVAAAALGAIGFGFWPDSSFTGDYYHAIRNAMSLIAQAEKAYLNGKRKDQELICHFRNTIKKTFPYGQDGATKTVTFPDFSNHLRTTVHYLDGDWFLTVFNYHDTLPMFLEPVFTHLPQEPLYLSELDGVSYGRLVPGETVFDVPPTDVKVLRLSKNNPGTITADLKTIRQRMADSLKQVLGNQDFKTIAKDGASASWRIPQGGKSPMLMLKNAANEQILLDVFRNPGELVYWHNTVGQSPIGQLMLTDQSRIQGPYPYVLSDLKVDQGVASATFTYVFKTPDAGEFPYQDLILRQTYAIGKPGQCTITCTVTNPTDHDITLGLRLRNRIFKTYQTITFGKRTVTPGAFTQSLIFQRPKTTSTFLPKLKRENWTGETVKIQAPKRTLTLDFPDFDGFYIWNGTAPNGFSLEPFTRDITLKPGQTKQATVTMTWGR